MSAPSFLIPEREEALSRQFKTHGAKVEAQQIRVEEEGRRVWALVEMLPSREFRILGWME